MFFLTMKSVCKGSAAVSHSFFSVGSAFCSLAKSVKEKGISVGGSTVEVEDASEEVSITLLDKDIVAGRSAAVG